MSDLDQFTRAYIEALLWSESDGKDESLQSQNYDASDIAPESLAKIVAECRDFQAQNAGLLVDLCPTQCGHDFLLTRNRHGAGFWDRGLGDLGRTLTDAAHFHGETYAYVGDDGKVYVS